MGGRRWAHLALRWRWRALRAHVEALNGSCSWADGAYMLHWLFGMHRVDESKDFARPGELRTLVWEETRKLVDSYLMD